MLHYIKYTYQYIYIRYTKIFIGQILNNFNVETYLLMLSYAKIMKVKERKERKEI